MDEGIGTGEGRAPGRAALRLCNLVAQSPRTTKRRVQAGSGEGADRKRRRAVGDDLLQDLQELRSR